MYMYITCSLQYVYISCLMSCIIINLTMDRYGPPYRLWWSQLWKMNLFFDYLLPSKHCHTSVQYVDLICMLYFLRSICFCHYKCLLISWCLIYFADILGMWITCSYLVPCTVHYAFCIEKEWNKKMNVITLFM